MNSTEAREAAKNNSAVVLGRWEFTAGDDAFFIPLSIARVIEFLPRNADLVLSHANFIVQFEDGEYDEVDIADCQTTLNWR